MTSTARPLLVLVGSGLLSLALLALLAVVGHDDPATGVDEAVLTELRDGDAVLLMRHALTDQSTSDADPTARGGCDQQRPLSAEGREQAERVGRRLQQLGVPVTRVLASPFCRTADTATLLAAGFGLPADVVEQTDDLLSLTAALDDTAAQAILDAGFSRIDDELGGDGVAVLVTHTQNIEVLTGQLVEEGDAVVLVPGGDRSRVLDVVPAADW